MSLTAVLRQKLCLPSGDLIICSEPCATTADSYSNSINFGRINLFSTLIQKECTHTFDTATLRVQGLSAMSWKLWFLRKETRHQMHNRAGRESAKYEMCMPIQLLLPSFLNTISFRHSRGRFAVITRSARSSSTYAILQSCECSTIQPKISLSSTFISSRVISAVIGAEMLGCAD